MTDWEQIRNKHGPAIWGVVFRILAHYEDARDCMQEVLFDAFRSRQAATVRNWRGYLCWLATRRAIDRLRSRRRERGEPLSGDPVSPKLPDLVEQTEAIAIVRTALAQLPESQATAFWLSSIEQLTYSEIAEQMHSTPNAVGLLIHRARHELKQRLRHLAHERSPKK